MPTNLKPSTLVPTTPTTSKPTSSHLSLPRFGGSPAFVVLSYCVDALRNQCRTAFKHVFPFKIILSTLRRCSKIWILSLTHQHEKWALPGPASRYDVMPSHPHINLLLRLASPSWGRMGYSMPCASTRQKRHSYLIEELLMRHEHVFRWASVGRRVWPRVFVSTAFPPSRSCERIALEYTSETRETT